MNHSTPNRRKGIVLVIVLSMLLLFSVLVAGYVIFANQAASVMPFDVIPATAPIDVNELLDKASGSIIRGSDDHHSATFDKSLLEDLYGNDGWTMRVGHDRVGGSMPVVAGGPDARGVYLQSGTGVRFLKFPTSVALWHRDGTLPTDVDAPSPPPANLHTTIDDWASGRSVTFEEGPLINQTFRIVRSYGTDNSGSLAESYLASGFVIDLDEAANAEIVVNEVSTTVNDAAALSANDLLYSYGPDELPGRGGFDDDGDGAVDERDEAGYPASDDYGYSIVINGGVFNGNGLNPRGVTGMYRNPASPTSIDPRADRELQFASRLIGENVYGDNGSAERLLPQMDEQWDAADMENLHLAWQPSDHRSNGNMVYTGALFSGADYSTVNDITGSHIIPSFHRPEVINYLLNAPIVIPSDPDPTTVTRTFWDLDGSDTDDSTRLAYLVTRLRRATIRPLNFEHAYGFAGNDLDGDGSQFDGNPGFTGSNPTPLLSDPIDLSLPFATLKERVQRLATWLVNGPWDVDNDGDGIPDSVWVNVGLDDLVASDGTIVRPMIAALIEDLDGKININHAGNQLQLVSSTFSSTNLTNYSNDIQYLACVTSLNQFGRGGGLGPAELNFSHLFDEGRAAPTSPNLGPLYLNQVTQPPSNPYLTRYGNLLNVRYGSPVRDYLASSIPAGSIFMPGFGTAAVAVDTSWDDIRGQTIFPSRVPAFNNNVAPGKPVDMFGRGVSRKSRSGDEVFDAPANPLSTVANDLINTPYEYGFGDDREFDAGDFIRTMRNQDGGDLSTLLSDEVQRNATLKNLITTESWALDVPETRGHFSVSHFVLSRLVGAASTNPEVHLERILAPEFRKGSLLNLNRQLGNGRNDNSDALSMTDETAETQPATSTTTTAVIDRQAGENAFPQLATLAVADATVPAHYSPLSSRNNGAEPSDFDGIDTDNDGIPNIGWDSSDSDTIPETAASGNELLARHLYCLMYILCGNQTAASNINGADIFPNFPFPETTNFTTTDYGFRNRYAARRIAQWAVNAVDSRDTDSICTRLRYDVNPFDGFDLNDAAANVVWGMESPEVEISESFAAHDKRLRRALTTPPDPSGESNDDDAMTDPDSDMDQFRTPEASAFVELHSLRSPNSTSGTSASLPAELYTNGGLDLGRVVGIGNNRSPVWRLAVGEPAAGNPNRSVRWMFDSQRLAQKLAITDATQVQYLGLAGAAAATARFDADDQGIRHTAEATTPVGDSSLVYLGDDDFNPTNGSPAAVQLRRFVWFANLVPDTSLNILSDPASGMTVQNVFFNAPDQTDPADLDLPENASTLLAPGQYAMIAPRDITHFGQRSTVTAPLYEHDPSPQRVSFSRQTWSGIPGALKLFRFNYFDLNDSLLAPRFREEDNGGDRYGAEAVVPIIARQLYPDEVATRADWATYRSNVGASTRVELGFNISAPLTGADYYTAPTHRISAGGPAGGYPLVDGYYDYDNGTGQHPDAPFDHVATTPMGQNGWDAIGTHQEAASLFLQRLADPSRPFNAKDNPYVTVDLAPMDLTTFNGEGDPTETIGGTGPRAGEIADSDASSFDGTNFTPAIRFDTRRKIPDVTRDRGASALALSGSDANDLSSYERFDLTERPAFSSSHSVLRQQAPSGAGIRFNYPLGAMWNAANTPNDAGIDSTYSSNTPYSTPPTPWGNSRYDSDPYRQTLGFVNREYGRPAGWDSSRPLVTPASGTPVDPAIHFYGRGMPMGSSFLSVFWNDREFQSPLDLVNVPATSWTGLSRQFSPGSILQDSGRREVPVEFDHLLGFSKRFASPSSSDAVPIGRATNLTAALRDDNPDVETSGDRTPFELLFDYVTTGSPNYLDRRWYSPALIQYRTPSSVTNEMFNRVVDYLQPPYNYLPELRVPGRVNLNTMPDYIRAGGASSSAEQQTLLDTYESPENTSASAGTGIGYTVSNNSLTDLSTSFTSSQLFGSGAIFRSFAWAGSSAYDLDSTTNHPTVLGDADAYQQVTDSRFGKGFKAFIESRRGYPTARSSSRPGVTLGNPDLDWRYPTRFAGVFSTANGAAVPSVQRFMNPPKDNDGSDEVSAARRRTHDMTVLRPHPDYDLRTVSTADRTAADTPGNTVAYSLNVETRPSGLGTIPDLPPASTVRNLRMTRLGQGLFERSLPELHKEFRHLGRASDFRHENAARYRNSTTHHSNVYNVRMTVGLFVVDATSGAVGSEYVNPAGEITRGSATFVVDRSIPVGFQRGSQLNTDRTVIYQAFDQ
jgi:hypothetical protein